MTSGPRIASIRNQLTQKFLDHPARPEWLWMVDSDMVFEYQDLLDMLEVADPAERPIIGGLCFGGRATVFPTLYRLVDPKENSGNVIQVITDFPDNALVKVDATGAACLLIHRSVLEKVQSMFPAPHHWFSESVYQGMEFGEDWTFCLRAAQAGFPIHVHTGVRIGHVKPRVIGLEDFLSQRERNTV